MFMAVDSRGWIYLVFGDQAVYRDGTVRVPPSRQGINYGPVTVDGGSVYVGGALIGTYNLALVPYGLLEGSWLDPRYGIFVDGDRCHVIDLATTRREASLLCRGRWDHMPVYPFSDVKSVYCTDGFIVWVDLYGYGVVSAPSGVAYFTDAGRPNMAFVERPVEEVALDEWGGAATSEYMHVSLSGLYAGRYEYPLDERRTAMPLTVRDGLAMYVEYGDRNVVVFGGRTYAVESVPFVTPVGLVSGRRLYRWNGDVEELACEAAAAASTGYVCLEGGPRFNPLPP